LLIFQQWHLNSPDPNRQCIQLKGSWGWSSEAGSFRTFGSVKCGDVQPWF